MKRLLLSCFLLFAVTVGSFAQSTPPLDVAAPVSKAEYVAKVAALNNALTASNTTLAETLFGEVNTLVNSEMKVMRYKMRDAATDGEKAAHLTVIKTQREYFATALNLKHAGMVPNRAALVTALNNFGDTME